MVYNKQKSLTIRERIEKLTKLIKDLESEGDFNRNLIKDFKKQLISLKKTEKRGGLFPTEAKMNNVEV